MNTQLPSLSERCNQWCDNHGLKWVANVCRRGEQIVPINFLIAVLFVLIVIACALTIAVG